MKKKRLCFAMVFIAILCSAKARADGIVDFSSFVGQTVSLTVLPYASGENRDSYYVGLTEGYLNGDPTESFEMFCDDFLNRITAPITYLVTVVSLSPAQFTSDSLGLTLAQLQQQATLGTAFGVTPSGNTTQDADAQEAIWNFTGGTFPSNPNMVSLETTSLATYAARDYSNSFLLDVTGSGQQAFMPVTTSSAPESPTVVLLLGALLILLGFRRRAV